MSHEIRTPLTAIIGYSEILAGAEAQGVNDAGQFETADTIRRNCEHLLNIVNEILDLSKIEEGKLSIEWLDCDTGSMIRDVVGTVRHMAERKGLNLAVKVETPVPATVRTDPTRLKQVLTNLLSNAIKFTDRGTVTLSVHYRPGTVTPTPPLQFVVSDTGIGMTPEQLRSVFEPFTQADASTTRRFGGTGLGLTISQRLARLLGGDLTARSEPGVGTTCTVAIDPGTVDPGSLRSIDPRRLLAGPHEESMPLLEERKDGLLGVRVLLAEDSRDTQRLITHLLKRVGAHTDVAETGRQATDMALAAQSEGHPYDLILMDMHMPETNGLTAVGELRSRGYTGKIIALTASALTGTRDRCLRAGCDDYATKPIKRDELIGLLIDHRLRTSQPSVQPTA